MVSVAAFRKIALSLPDAAEAPHFERAAFLVEGKIFATLSRRSPARDGETDAGTAGDYDVGGARDLSSACPTFGATRVGRGCI